MKHNRKLREVAIRKGSAFQVVNDRHRAEIIDWLVTIHTKEQMKQETLHLTVFLLDIGLVLTNVQTLK